MSDETELRRRRFLAATGAGTCAAMAGCNELLEEEGTATPDEDEEEDDEDDEGTTTSVTTEDPNRQDQQSERFRRINGSIYELDPVAATDTDTGVVLEHLMDGLTTYPNGELEVEPSLATAIEMSDDATTYRFSLREDATFHDGTSVTSEDVVYSFERLAASPHTRREYFVLASLGVTHDTNEVAIDGSVEVRYAPGTLGVRAVDETTVELDLEAPFHSALEMLAYTAFSVVPAGSAGDIPGWDSPSPPEYYSEYDVDSSTYEEFSEFDPIGAGAFEFGDWAEREGVSVDRFEDYHGDTSIVAGVDWEIISDEQAAYHYSMEINTDELSIPTSQFQRDKLTIDETDSKGRDVGTYGPLQNGETAQYLGVPTINSFYIGMNTAVRKSARKALAHVFNQPDVADQIFEGRVEPGYHFTPPGIFPGGADGYEQHAENNYPYSYGASNVDRARELMEADGYTEDDPYQFTFTYYQSGASTWGEMGERLRDQLASAHIDMTLESAPFSSLLSRGRQGNLEAYSLGWIMDWPAPDNFLQNAYPPKTNTSQGGGATGLYVDWNQGAGRQVAIDAWETIQENPGPSEEEFRARQENYLVMEEAMWEDMILLPTHHRTDERFLYEWVDWDPFGYGGLSRAQCNDVEIGERPR